MPRSGPGAADRELIGQLAARGLVVSVAQLERWRRAGLLPRHARDWPGRGRGSVSRLDPETVEIAAALARHARQGRDLRLAVLGWFAEAGLSEALDTVVPEPPEQAVLDDRGGGLGQGQFQLRIRSSSMRMPCPMADGSC